MTDCAPAAGPVTGPHGRIVGIYLAPAAGAPMRAVDAVQADAGVGLAGDRYATSVGTWSRGARPHPGRQVTLIEVEAIRAVARDYGLTVEPADTRRNLVTCGVALNHLVGREFLVGDVRLRGIKLCEPCRHLEQVSGKPIREPLIHRGGLKAEVLTSGIIHRGDPVAVAPQ